VLKVASDGDGHDGLLSGSQRPFLVLAAAGKYLWQYGWSMRRAYTISACVPLGYCLPGLPRADGSRVTRALNLNRLTVLSLDGRETLACSTVPAISR
jgi:hypothetical protein